MHPYLNTRRRVLFRAARSYDTADTAWKAGLREASALVPETIGRSRWMIGNPGSRIRRLYDDREKALQRLAVAHLKLKIAQDRLARRQNALSPRTVMLLTRS